MFEKQTQETSGSSTAIQAGGHVVVNVVSHGLSVADVKELALDVFRANLTEFKGIAMQTAYERGEEVTEKFLEKLQRENPEGLQQAQTPDFQDALFTVQKEHAKAGDKQLADLLVDLLVDRTKEANRNLIQLVLNESLHTAPKLTSGQIAVLSAIFMFKYVNHNGLRNIADLASFFRSHIVPATGSFVTGAAAFNHLEFTGCGTASVMEVDLGDVLLQAYGGLFKTGFDLTRIEQAKLPVQSVPSLIMRCLNDKDKYQVAALNERVLKEKIGAANLTREQGDALTTLSAESTMDAAVVRQKVVEAVPELDRLVAAWATSPMRSFNLNSVGIAIAHANVKRLVGEFAPLSRWINEHDTEGA